MGIRNLFRKRKNAFNISASIHQDLEFTAVEQYKILRNNIKFTIPTDIKCPIIGITSPVRGEGKSTSAINLSYVLAEEGKKVLLIDGDLRIPSIASKMKMSNSFGLTNLLVGDGANVEGWKSKLNPNLYILTSGDIPPNPSELLGSKRMENVLSKMQDMFDFIIIDLPPVNLVPDAMSVAKNLTGMIIVIREEYTSKKDLDRCFWQIKFSNINLLGCLINDCDNGERKYKKYRYYKQIRSYRYQSYEKDKTDGAD